MLTQPEETPVEPCADEPDLRAVPAGLFAFWRRTVSWTASSARRIGPGMRALVRAWTDQWRLVWAYHTGPETPWDPALEHERSAAAAVGLRAFVFGLFLTGLGIAATTSLWLPIAVGVGNQVLWAGARFIIIAMLMPRGALTRKRLSTAYLAGLLPYAVAATWLLQLVALVVSAGLTLRGLTGAGVDRPDARTAIAWSFGGQVGIIVGGWLLRAIIVLVAG